MGELPEAKYDPKELEDMPDTPIMSQIYESMGLK